MNLRFWLKWSWRDLRARWLQVVAIALIIALGTGVFAGLGGQKHWRTESLDVSYNRLNMYDLRVKLADGSYVEGETLAAELTAIEGIAQAETRLIFSTLVDASTGDEAILVSGRVLGVDISEGGPHISSIYIEDGRGFESADAGQPTVIAEYKFVDHYGLEPGDPIRISGNTELDFVGSGHTPEYFQIMPENGAFMGEASLAILMVSLETAQSISGREGMVNDAVVLLESGADRDEVRAAIEARLSDVFPQTGIDILTPEDDEARELLYSDAENDQVVWNMVAMLFLIGAALGAFNLASRIVEAQRRQIGIGMALGVPRFWIAFRPMLVGLQIAVLGTFFGLIVGLILSQVFVNIFQSLLPLPYWEVDLYVPGFLQATVLGILLPFVATLIPVWRAVRVAPIDAIKTGHLVAKGGGLVKLLNRVPLPGRSFMQMPFRNVLRSPWRTLLTVLSITMAILLLTAFIGFLDTFEATLHRAEDAYRYQGADRINVNLDFFYPVDNGEISGLTELKTEDGEPYFEQVEPALVVGGTLDPNGDELETMLELHDMQNAIWVPDLLEGDLDQPGIIISEKAAEDLNLSVNDTVMLQHPRREGEFSYRLAQSEVPVVGIHNNPLRVLSYMDMRQASLLGLEGRTNLLVAEPAAGMTEDELKRALMTQPGVASVQPVAEISDALDEVLSIFTTILTIVQVVVMFMAFLIAFNSTSISVDERVREIATMFAFGLPIRTVTRMQVIENLITGLLGTLLGVALGWVVLNQLLAAYTEEQLADFKLVVTISAGTLVVSVLLGILVVALTPLLSIRTMLKMDVPSTLRVME